MTKTTTFKPILNFTVHMYQLFKALARTNKKKALDNRKHQHQQK